MRRAVAAENDLLLRVVERVKRVEKLGLRALFADDELDVVDEQDVDAAIALAEFENAIVANRIDDFVHETLGRDVGELQPRAVREHVVPDRVHQMRFAESHAAVEEQRVIRARRRFRNGAARGMRELIRRADDECFEGIARTQIAARLRRPRFGLRPWARCRGGIRRIEIVARPPGSVPSGRKTTVAPRAAHIRQRFGDHAGVVLVHPFDSGAIGYAHEQRRSDRPDERRVSEPGVKAVVVDLGLDSSERFVPDRAGHVSSSQFFPIGGTFACCRPFADSEPAESYRKCPGGASASGNFRNL